MKKKENANTASASTSQIHYEHAFMTIEYALATMANTKSTETPRILDSGTTSHFDPNKANFTNFPTIEPQAIDTADSRVFYATDKGDVRIKVPSRTGQINIMLKDTLYTWLLFK